LFLPKQLKFLQEKISQKDSLIKSHPYSQINHSCYEEAMKKVEQGFTFLIKWLWFETLFGIKFFS